MTRVCDVRRTVHKSLPTSLALVAIYLLPLGLSAERKTWTSAATGSEGLQEPVTVQNVESCISTRNGNGGYKMFYNTCSFRIYASVYDAEGLVFDGYYNSGHMDDIPPHRNVMHYKYFACPASATAFDTNTGGEADFSTRSYVCQESGT